MSQIPIGWLTNRGACGCPFVQQVGWWGRWYYLFLPKGHTSSDQTWQGKIPELNGGLHRRIIDQWSIFHCHGWFLEDTADDRSRIRLKKILAWEHPGRKILLRKMLTSAGGKVVELDMSKKSIVCQSLKRIDPHVLSTVRYVFKYPQFMKHSCGKWPFIVDLSIENCDFP